LPDPAASNLLASELTAHRVVGKFPTFKNTEVAYGSADRTVERETEQRLYLLSAWRVAPFYSDRERAALAWTEAVTQLASTNVPDHVYAGAREHFSQDALVNLTLAIVAINGWNRLCVSFRATPGKYQPAKLRAAAS